MVKVAIYPPNSLILADLIERKGHTPLVLQKQIRQKIKDPEIETRLKVLNTRLLKFLQVFVEECPL